MCRGGPSGEAAGLREGGEQGRGEAGCQKAGAQEVLSQGRALVATHSVPCSQGWSGRRGMSGHSVTRVCSSVRPPGASAVAQWSQSTAQSNGVCHVPNPQNQKLFHKPSGLQGLLWDLCLDFPARDVLSKIVLPQSHFSMGLS